MDTSDVFFAGLSGYMGPFTPGCPARPVRRGRVDGVLHAHEVNPQGPHLVAERDQVTHRAGESVELPDRERIEAPLVRVPDHPIQLFSQRPSPLHLQSYITIRETLQVRP